MDSAFPLQVDDLTVQFGALRALDGVTFAAPAACLVGVVGPNGAGKSTLFRAILGLTAFGGTVRCDGQPAYVPQGDVAPRDFPATALDVALMGRYSHRRWWQRLSRDDRAAARAALEAVGMDEHAACAYGTLSGGQRQRVVLARALAHDRRVILLDEPMTGVDGVSREAIARTVARLRDEGRTLLMSTHDLSDAARTCDRLLFLNRTVVAYGEPAAIFTPETVQRAYAGAAVLLTGPDGMQFGLLDDAHHHDHGHDHPHQDQPHQHAEHHER